MCIFSYCSCVSGVTWKCITVCVSKKAETSSANSFVLVLFCMVVNSVGKLTFVMISIRKQSIIICLYYWPDYSGYVRVALACLRLAVVRTRILQQGHLSALCIPITHDSLFIHTPSHFLQYTWVAYGSLPWLGLLALYLPHTSLQYDLLSLRPLTGGFFPDVSSTIMFRPLMLFYCLPHPSHQTNIGHLVRYNMLHNIRHIRLCYPHCLPYNLPWMILQFRNSRSYTVF